jgi:hypothetical protein
MVYLLPLLRTLRLPAVDQTDAPGDVNGLVRFAERRNMVYTHVPSHFNWSLPAPSGTDKNVWIYISTFPYGLMTSTGTGLL